jgi:hypothetical protein
MLVGSHVRMRLLEALWPVLRQDERHDEFIDWFNVCDAPYRCREFLLRALGEFRRSARRLFDSQAARERFAGFTDVVTIYRGGVEKETIDERLGVSWTLNRDIAIWFATQHPLRNRSDLPVLLTERVNRGAIAGFLVERQEDAVLIVPDDIFLDEVESLDRTEELPIFLEWTQELEITKDLEEGQPHRG